MRIGLKGAVVAIAAAALTVFLWTRVPPVAAGRTVSSAAHSRRPPGSERSVAGPQYCELRLAHPARPALAVIPAPPRTAAPVLADRSRWSLAEELRALGAVGGVRRRKRRRRQRDPLSAVGARAEKGQRRALARARSRNPCMPGVPRATYMPYPFQILQSADAVLIGA